MLQYDSVKDDDGDLGLSFLLDMLIPQGVLLPHRLFLILESPDSQASQPMPMLEE